MTDHRQNRIDRQRRRSAAALERQRQVLDDELSEDDPKRVKEIERAIKKQLAPIEGADIAFAVRLIEWRIKMKPFIAERLPPALPKEGAEQLRALAQALRALNAAAARLNPAAVDAINQEKERRHLTWDSLNPAWSLSYPYDLSDFLDEHWPSLIEAAEAAAKSLDKKAKDKKAHWHRTPGTGNQYLEGFSAELAALYELMRGKQAPKSGRENRFSRWLLKIWNIAGIPAGERLESPQYWARKGATLHRRAKAAQAARDSQAADA
jgi:hypothetical protein